MNLDLRFALILLALCLPFNSVYAVTVHKSLDINDLFKPLTSKTNLTDGNSVTYTFSGTTADYINYVQLCMATDNTCSSCGAPYATYKILTANNGVPYNTVGTAWNIQASTIQNYLTSNGYPLSGAPYYLGIYVQSQDLVCNSNHSYCSTSQDNAGHALCVQVGTDGSLTREDNGVAVLSGNTTPYLYVNNGNTTSTNANTTSVCPAYATPFACTTSNNSGSTPNAPYGIAVDPPSKNVYVMSRGSVSNSLSCSISSTNGGLNCSILSFAADLALKPCTAQGIAIDPPGQNAYVTCTNNTVYKCALGGTTCNAITLSGATLSNPIGIVIDPTNSYMAIANTGGSNLIACKIDGTGCATGNPGNATAYVTVDNTGTYLYTGKSTGSSVYSCPVTVTGGTISIGTCSIKGSGSSSVKGIALNPTGTNAYIAIQSSGGLINSCPASPGAAISGACVGTVSSGLFTGMQGAAWGNVVGP